MFSDVTYSEAMWPSDRCNILSESYVVAQISDGPGYTTTRLFKNLMGEFPRDTISVSIRKHGILPFTKTMLWSCIRANMVIIVKTEMPETLNRPQHFCTAFKVPFLWTNTDHKDFTKDNTSTLANRQHTSWFMLLATVCTLGCIGCFSQTWTAETLQYSNKVSWNFILHSVQNSHILWRCPWLPLGIWYKSLFLESFIHGKNHLWWHCQWALQCIVTQSG